MFEEDTFLRAYEALIDDVSPGERTVVAKINTAAIDSFRTVIDPLGGNFDNYNKYRTVLWEHGMDVRGRVPVGRSLWVKTRKQEKDVIAKTKFNDDEFSDGIFKLYQDGGLRGFSIRFDPVYDKCSAPTPAELRSRPDLADCRCMIRSWSLQEYSAVAMPSNPDALALSVSRGLWVPDKVRSMLAGRTPTTPPETIEEPELPPLVGSRLETVRAARRNAIRAEADELRARMDLRRGKV